MKTYKIVRRYFKNSDKVVIKTGLTLAEAKKHCRDPETSSKTCTNPAMVEHTEKHGPWFDGFTEE